LALPIFNDFSLGYLTYIVTKKENEGIQRTLLAFQSEMSQSTRTITPSASLATVARTQLPNSRGGQRWPTGVILGKG
jgi:hypothetical protein